MKAATGQRLLLASLPLFCGALIWWLGTYQPLLLAVEQQCLNWRMSWLPALHPEWLEQCRARLVLVPISGQIYSHPSFSPYKDQPLPRSFHAGLLTRLKALGARVVVFDLLFDAPRKEDDELARAARSFGRVVWGCSWLDEALVRPNTTLRRAVPYVGHTRVPEGNAAVDRVEPAIADGQVWVPAMSVQAARLDAGEAGAPLERSRGQYRYGSLAIPVDQGGTFRINFLLHFAQPDQALATVPYDQVWDAATSRIFKESALFKDKIVVVGDTTDLSHDIHATPVGPLPGYEIQAYALATLLTRSFLRQVPPWGVALLFALLPLGSMASSTARHWTFAVALGGALLLAYLILCLWLFVAYSLVLPLSGPALAAGLAGIAGLALRGRTQEQHTARLEEVAGQYVSPQVGAQGAPRGLVTLFFTDIEGSTRLSARLGERFEEVREQHFALLRQAVLQHNGFEVETAGDALFAVFASASDAVQAARTAQLALAAHAWPPATGGLRVRMGLHTGRPYQRRDRGRLTYRGPATNCAAAIMGAAAGGQVLLSEAAWRAATAENPGEAMGPDLFRPAGTQRLKNEEEISLYELLWQENAARGN